MTRKDSAREDSRTKFNRRNFLAGVAVAGAADTSVPSGVKAATSIDAPTAPPPRPSALPPNAHVAAAETGTPKEITQHEGGKPGSDFMVDVIKTLDIKY